MPARFIPESGSTAGYSDRAPLSRRERRAKRSGQQQLPAAKVRNQGGQVIPPARGHNNYRRG